MKRKFTPRQREIIELLLDGKERKQIARELEISERTLRSHLINIKNISGCKTWVEFILRYK